MPLIRPSGAIIAVSGSTSVRTTTGGSSVASFRDRGGPAADVTPVSSSDSIAASYALRSLCNRGGLGRAQLGCELGGRRRAGRAVLGTDTSSRSPGARSDIQSLLLLLLPLLLRLLPAIPSSSSDAGALTTALATALATTLATTLTSGMAVDGAVKLGRADAELRSGLTNAASRSGVVDETTPTSGTADATSGMADATSGMADATSGMADATEWGPVDVTPMSAVADVGGCAFASVCPASTAASLSSIAAASVAVPPSAAPPFGAAVSGAVVVVVVAVVVGGGGR